MNQSYSNESRMGGAMYESEVTRLQREADNFTTKFEHEKKRLMILEDTYKQATTELAEKQKHLKTERPSTAKVKKDTAQVKVLENQLDKNYKDLNKLQSENKGLREQINVMRKEQRNQQRVNQNYSKEMKGVEDKAIKLNNVTYHGQRMSEELNNQILSLKAKNEEQKYKFQNSIKDLQKKLREKDDTELEKAKSKAATGPADTATAASGEFSNPAALLKLRLQKWTNNNKEKKNLMDMYIRNVNIIEDAFTQIQQQTGIGSIEEIVTTFIKADEQNYSLYNYVNQINSEIDMIEEQNK